LGEALPDATIEDATGFINTLRLCKTPAEVEKFRVVNEIAGFGLAWFRENLMAGMTEIELAGMVNAQVAINGSGYKGVKSARAFAQVSSGPNTERGWRPCEITTSRAFQNGDIVLLELGVVADGYWADNTRVLVTGGANQKQQDIYGLIRTAQQAAIDRIRPGVPMCEVDQAAREVINEAGYGEYFFHVTGHGVGWRYHEFPPLLHPDNPDPLQEGMITSVEPGLYIPGFGGMRVEDNVAVGSKGPDVLSTFNKDLI
jgi:Xaa-Pro dipeptidase